MISRDDFIAMAKTYFNSDRLSIDRKVDMYIEDYRSFTDVLSYKYNYFQKDYGEGTFCFGNIKMSGNTSADLYRSSLAVKTCLFRNNLEIFSKQVNSPMIPYSTVNGGYDLVLGVGTVYNDFNTVLSLGAGVGLVNPFVYKTANQITSVLPISLTDFYDDSLEVEGVMFNRLSTIRTRGDSNRPSQVGVLIDYFIARLL